MQTKTLNRLVIGFFICVILLTFATGCKKESTPVSSAPAVWVTMNLEQDNNRGQMSPEAVSKVLIYRWKDYYSDNKTPVLTISDEAGLKLFANIVNNAVPINALLDVVAPPYEAELYCKSRVVALGFNIDYPKDKKSSGGMYINECHTEKGYHIVGQDAKAFLDVYGRALPDSFS